MSINGALNDTVIVCGKGRTKQSMKDECDINGIISRYAKTGLLTPVNEKPAMFVDVSEVGDYRSAMDNVRAVQSIFMQLPAGTRANFDNDPAIFLDYAANPGNEEEMIEMGLLPRPEQVEVEKAPIAVPMKTPPPADEPPEEASRD